MGGTPQFTALPNFPISNNAMIVAPFGADIDTSVTGEVRYADISQFGVLNSYDVMRDMSDFIIANTLDDFFRGKDMMVAEWDFVVPLGGPRVSSKFTS